MKKLNLNNSIVQTREERLGTIIAWKTGEALERYSIRIYLKMLNCPIQNGG